MNKQSLLRKLIREEIKRALKEGDDFSGSGLIVTGRTPIDNNSIKDMIEDRSEDFHGVWNAREGYWFFPEDEENLDGLEYELEDVFRRLGINARFESQ